MLTEIHGIGPEAITLCAYESLRQIPHPSAISRNVELIATREQAAGVTEDQQNCYRFRTPFEFPSHKFFVGNNVPQSHNSWYRSTTPR